MSVRFSLHQNRQWCVRFLIRLALISLISLPSLFVAAINPGPAQAEGTAPPSDDRAAFLSLPLQFIANTGQTSPEVRFSVQGAGHSLFFTPAQVVFHATGVAEPTAYPAESLVQLRFLGANHQPAVEGVGRLPANANFFLGADPGAWRTDVPTFAAVAYRDLYPGVDLHYSGSYGQLKSEFRLQPGVDPTLIRMSYTGVRSVRLLPDGSLTLDTGLGKLIEAAPYIYQETTQGRQEIPGRYIMREAGPATVVISFDIPVYDPDLPLVIDPILGFSTYLGGSGSDSGEDIAVDGSGRIYVVGSTPSQDFPITNGAIDSTLGGNNDVFLTQIIRAGEVYTYGFSTYLGGSQDDFGSGIAVSTDGDVTLTGQTKSANFPTHMAPRPTFGGNSDAFVTRIISASGVYSFAFSTYLGSTGFDYGSAVALDSAGNAWVTGNTTSSSFPVTSDAIQPTYAGGGVVVGGDAFITQLITGTSSYTYGYSSFLGGSGIDYGNDIALSPGDQVFLTGETWSANFPIHKQLMTKPGDSYDYDAFATSIISASGAYTYAYATYLGGTAYDTGNSITVDSSGSAIVVGATRSTNMHTSSNAIQPTFNGGEWDAFVTQIVDSGGTPAYGYASYLGGSSTDRAHAVAAGNQDSFYVTGQTWSSNFPTTVDAISRTLRGSSDVFAVYVITTSGTYTYSIATYLGGSSGDAGMGAAVGVAGEAYLTGWTQSTDFPLEKAIDTILGGDQDAFVARLGWTGLYITKSVNRTIVEAGDSVSFTLTYVNDSAGPATNVVITDTLPISLTNVSYTSTGAVITPTGATSYTWQVADLAQGQGGAITVMGTVLTNTVLGAVISNTACITATVLDPYPDDNCASATLTVGQGLILPVVFKNH
jgi:uncharacterized repeat protein (TIGR01451 family)